VWAYRDSLSPSSPILVDTSGKGTNKPTSTTGLALTDPKINKIVDSVNNGTVAALSGYSSAVNYLTVYNGPTGSGPSLYATGSDTNISMLLAPKGTGPVQIYSGTAGVTPRLQVFGVDTNVGLDLQTKNAGTVQINGAEASRRTIQTITAATTLLANGDYVVFISGASGAVTLPTAVGNTSKYTIKNIYTVSKTISTTISQTIDGSTTLVLPAGNSVDLVSDGSNWRTI
jgi:hypothetical protein